MDWVQGRAFVPDETGRVEYFYRFEKSAGFPKKECVRSFAGGLTELEKCRPLDYVCAPEYLRISF
jgi:hypothetical protein